MGWKEAAEPYITRMPTVSRPEGHVPFKRKMAWTAFILVVYFFLTNVALWGLGQNATDLFGQFRSLLAGGQGSVLQLGIGPIVTASIVLQLLGGANLLGLDTNDPRDQAIYQGLQKLLVLVMICLTGLPMVFLGGFLPADTALASALGIGVFGVKWIIFAQIFVGGVLILYMDEVISKWGVGSGIGLFIVAGVSQQLIVGLLYWSGAGTGSMGVIPYWINVLLGNIENVTASSLLFNSTVGLLPIITTLLIYAVVVYAESVRIEIPLSHARVKGARGRFPVKLIYASVLPMILVRALQANIQFLGRILRGWLGEAGMPNWLGVYTVSEQAGLQVAGGLFYYLAPIHSPSDWMWWVAGVGGAEPWQVLLRVAIDLTFMVIGGGIFAIFWVETADMGPEATAKQIQNSGMQIPGFRQNVGVIEKVMERYIPQVTVIGGALVGLLAVLANMMGTIGGVSGTGLLLTISITYKLYEEIAEEQLMEMHPMMRQMFGDQ
ncbi:preprotein translocase subunit SecY [Halarchaeum nitratireducens]|uniref:Protein translocase subunit SecY n=1 Tax=Halarchaeum nitratireducens TaxID=489913 RepID=A0A830G6Z7_9EURY|nr:MULTISPECIES: preprotein translocase subunit SecY [Halarchaeum]MBP2251331.1 preprotein translocase subunit SecY [Halarchaeum solikamskense]GGN07951.1 preprotein translocase subunit SecY [Halarchaeum nitratireducens]